ncbi:beta-lactamase-like protein [Corynascus novoguineensis]|uniref:Protein artemis n=1 Tax=Corynascus novoguineensis TaxID=1126955 RepID=A0AAN7CYT6_9PEZI|nr:beta-lactamase-like protein [Corynascus novoguineensis]
MSTFNGIVAEFPDIRGDVYCSAATKAMLLRLERYPCRINYADGILEARVQRYRHLRNLLKPIPLDTPTLLELEPGNHLQVTLLNANHCPGAVMFLFEGQGKAVLYTGDMRSEPWFINAIARSPSLIEYSSGLKTLDTIYLDTSFIDDIEFPTKSEGISELLRKVLKYPEDTIFHFQAWTYGYEDVWLALSKALGSKIHVDGYKMLMFRSLVAAQSDAEFAPFSHLAPEAPGLVGFMCGNTHHSGCLTGDERVRLHSCEKGSYCSTVKNSPVVWIRPIITRLPDGQVLAEIGVGGGGDDLEREAELDYLSPDDVDALLETLGDLDSISNGIREQLGQCLLGAIASGRKVPLELHRTAFRETNETDLINGLQGLASKLKLYSKHLSTEGKEALPNLITFPYSRHSSYPELCRFVGTFRPKEVWPCSVDIPRWLSEEITVERLFSQHCSGDRFRHDEAFKERFGNHKHNESINLESQVVSSASDAVHFSQVLERVPDHQSQTPTPLEDDHFDPTGFGGSQDSDLSEFALDTRLQAFQTILDNARGKTGGEVRLLSTTDNHSTLEPELGHEVTQPSGSVNISTCGAAL